MLRPLVQCQLSMTNALFSPYKRAKLSLQQPAYGECRLKDLLPYLAPDEAYLERDKSLPRDVEL